MNFESAINFIENSKIINISKTNLFHCLKSKTYINILFVCDAVKDCPFSEDEQNCSFPFDQIFRCNKSNLAIDYKLVCNHQRDCQDSSDETDCSKYLKLTNK